MATAEAISFRIRRNGRVWLVLEETRQRALGGIFATLAAALEFVDGEAARYRKAEAIVDLSRTNGETSAR
jgi:hypothetical protein